MFDLQGHLVSLMARDDTLQCQTERASDYYGLGVRLGIYFAWLQAYIANTLLPSEISSALDTNTIFLFTLCIAMVNDSRTKELAQIDGLILMHLCGGTVFGILSLWGYRTRSYLDQGPRAIKQFGGFGTQIRLMVSLGVSIFGLWFWLYGVTGSLVAMGPDDGSDPPNSPECATLFTFFFAKVRADGGIRIYYIIVCTCCIIYLGTMLLASTITGWFVVKKMIGSAKNKLWTNPPRPEYITGFEHRELRAIHKFLRIANLAWLIFSAMMVEFTLNFNHVTLVLGGRHNGGLNLPSQLLPFLVGTFGFIRTCYAVVQGRWRKKNDETSTSTPGPSHTPQKTEAGPEYTVIQMNSSSLEHNSNAFNEQEKRKSLPVRYLMAWLPWISVLQQDRQ